MSRLSLTEKDLPAIKDWQTGKNYKIVLTVKQVHSGLGSPMEMSEKNREVHAEYEIINAKEMKEKSSDTKYDKNILSEAKRMRGEY